MSDVQGVLQKDWHRDIRYPLIFPMAKGQKIACWFLGLMFGAMGVGMLFLGTRDQVEPVVAAFFDAMGVCLLFVPVYCVFYANRAQLTLDANTIEVRKAFSTRRLEVRDILGRRTIQTRSGSFPMIVPKSGRSWRVEVSTFGLDDRFKAWLNALPDLDAQDREATLAEVSRDTSLGSNPTERLAKLEKARQLGKALSVAAMALTFWGFAYPRPYGLVIGAAALLPWVAVVLLWAKPALFQLDGKAADVKPNLAVLLIMPPMMIAMRAVSDLTIVDLKRLFLWGAVMALPLVLAIGAAPRSGSVPGKGRAALMFLMLLFTATYSTGLLALTDALWDQAPPEVYPTAITGKDVSRGKSTTYYVHLAPWSRDIQENRIAVSRAFYEAVQKGDTTCVRLHPGKFGLRWMQLGGCG